MTNYFTLHELLYSRTALDKKIDSWPEDFWVIENLELKLLPVLNNLREAWGGSIKITSGYRSPDLNKAIGGSKTSVHMKGLAADMIPGNGKFKEFIEFASRYLKDNEEFDQAIIESSGSSKWFHLGIENNEGQRRGMVFNINL